MPVPATVSPPVPSPSPSPSPAPTRSALEALKARQQATWASGDFGQIGVRLQIVGETLCEAVDLRSGERVLDVAAGNGNASLAAARCYGEVTSTDYVPALLEQGRRRADADGLTLRFAVADAEQLPFEDGAFDVALSTFGVMFAPDQPRAAAELLRVVRPGGRIGLASWTPDGFVGEMLRVVSAFVPPPAGVRPPTAWGTTARLGELFGAAREVRSTPRDYTFRFRSPEHWIEVFRAYYGPTLKAFEAVPPERHPELTQALTSLLQRHDRGAGRGLVVPAAYLETVVLR